MFVVLLNGARVGNVVDLPYGIAVSKIDNETARRATEAEIRFAGFSPSVTMTSADPDTLPDGYRVEKAIEFGAPEKGVRPEIFRGWDVFAPNGRVPLNDMPFRNMAGARSHAHVHFEAKREAAMAAEKMAEADRAERSAREAAARQSEAAVRQSAATDDDPLAAIIIPEGWASMKPAELSLLAKSFNPRASGEKAIHAAITAELARRAAKNASV